MTKNKAKSKDLSLAATTSRVIKIRRRSRYEKPIHALWELFSEYSDFSTVHGIRYLGEKKRHWIERIFWVIGLTVSMVVCGKLIVDIYLKWEQIPVIVSFAEKSTPIWKIDFPAVTICPETKAKQTVLNYTNIYNILNNNKMEHNFTKNELDRVASVSKICRSHLKNNVATKLEGDLANSALLQHIKAVSPTLSEVFHRCEWQGFSRPCNYLFQEIMTEEGLCFTFNFLNASEVYRADRIASDYPMVRHNHTTRRGNPKTKYNRATSDDSTYPYRVYSASDGLAIFLRLFDKDIDFLCGGPVQGFKILLHASGEVPQISKYFYRIPLDHEVIMSVRPSIMTTTDKVISYEKKRRQCYFEGEKKLTFFKKYTQRNCELDCLTNHIIKKCNCASFSLPRNKTTKVCGLSKMRCYKDAELRLSMKDAMGTRRCDCLPACESISYDAELSQAKYDLREIYRAKNQTQGEDNRRQYARIIITFKENQFFAWRRSELYGGTDFLASTGGLLGLFMGVSVLSIIEAIYFCTLRLGCNLRRRRLAKKRRALQEKLLNVEPLSQPNETEVEKLYPEKRF